VLFQSENSSEEAELEEIRNLLIKWRVINEKSNPSFTMLGGGVSNLVVKVDDSGRSFVVKRPLARLRVNEDWFADRGRIMREASCLKIIAEHVGQEYAPKVIQVDSTHFACLLEYAPVGTVTWKHDLLNSKIDPLVTENAARFLIRFHANTRGNLEIQKEFTEISNFIELRINPYFKTISERHFGLNSHLNEIISGLTLVHICLVHGDFSPKNILLLPDGKIWVIDAEVAHYGNPAFDVAFCVNHLILKAYHLKSLPLKEQAEKFWQIYWKESSWSGQEDFTVRVLAALMLARVDGKSPVEYLNESDRAKVRQTSCKLIESRVDNFEELMNQVNKDIVKL
jgi:5-methylthioribose kinase